MVSPKVFISYSWTSQAHQERVKDWADRLMADGVNVVLDIYDLKEGHDKYAYMERMVTDVEVTHVLVVCDKAYAEKADARIKGVGTESQIISKEVYDKVDQGKFIPIVCEFLDTEQPCVPVFLKSRLYFNFSTDESVNSNWERLIRHLYGKPLHEKPQIGKPPPFVTEEGDLPSSPTQAKFASFRQAVLQGKPGVKKYRQEFLDACMEYSDALRVRKRPTLERLGEKILEDCGKLVLVRDRIVDWVLFEAESVPSEEFSESLIDFLEKLREQKARPQELGQWNDVWFEAHKLFVYETFLYIVAALVKTGAFRTLREIFTSHYLVPETERHGRQDCFDRFDAFYAHSDTLQSVLSPPGQRLYSAAAELVRRQANREDLPFGDVIEADLLVLLLSLINPDTRWYPQLLHYSGHYREFRLFVRATQRKYFQKLAIVTGIADVAELRKAVAEGFNRLGIAQWSDFRFTQSFLDAMNLEKLDTLR